ALKKYVGKYWSEKNGALRTFELRENKLVMVAPGLTSDLLPIADGQFEAVEADSEHKDRYVFTPSVKGEGMQLEAWEGGAQVTYTAANGTPPSPATLKDYVGSYSNDELNSKWILVVRNGNLIRQQWMAEDQELEPAFPDGFIGELSEGQFLMHFNRDGSGLVTSFDAATDMVRPMRFVKTGNGGAAK
ncbi:MAG: hypothetical protein WAN63_00005, partial [Candidatus Sulfotelmatobacter sp.]